ncbi:MAG: MBL fold metallo-hydrolase [Acidobacteriota bacterium]
MEGFRRSRVALSFGVAALLGAGGTVAMASENVAGKVVDTAPQAELIVLGVAQDGGVPQAGSPRPSWLPEGERRWATSIAVVDGEERYLFEATPDFREQLELLDRLAPTGKKAPGLAGIFLTHAHIGHYVGLMHLGHEAMGAKGVPVYAMPRMAEYLRRDGPWSQLVSFGNIALHGLQDGAPAMVGRLRVTPLRVPHREEFSEAVAYRIEGPRRSALFVPDIDSWRQWDERGVRLEELLAEVDYAFLDATFFADGEIPGRDMSGFPHPRIRETMERLAPLPARERGKVHFIHLNHTNPALDPESPERQQIEAAGFHVAVRGERFAF